MSMTELQRNLEKRGYIVHSFPDRVAALAFLNREIDGVSVGMGGSATLREMGVYEALSTHNEVWWHGDSTQVAAYGADTIRERAAKTEVYLSSVNGVSVGGSLINIDRTGNRIASTVWGHQKVYLIIGCNKVALTFEEAMWRARNIAAPKNAQRFGLKTPCAVHGDRCYDCDSPQRICRAFMVLEAPVRMQETHIVLIDEPLGF